MKITSAQADPDALPHGLKHVQVRVTKHGVVVQKRQGRRKKPPSRLQRYWQNAFGLAARMASNAIWQDQLTAREMAKGTEQVWRDILTMAALGRYYVVTNADGTVWPNVVPTLLQEPEPEPPPPEPEPEPEEDQPLQWNQWDTAYTAHNSLSAFAFKGATFTPQETRTVLEVASYVPTVVGGIYRAAIARVEASNILGAVVLSEPITGTVAARHALRWPLEVELLAGVQYCYLIGRTDQGAAHTFPIASQHPSQWLWPAITGQGVRLAQTEPAAGQALSPLGSNNAPPFGMRFKP